MLITKGKPNKFYIHKVKYQLLAKLNIYIENNYFHLIQQKLGKLEY
jgi:hypothetical protein